MYCFEHIPKTAGKTFSTALKLYYGNDYLLLKKDERNIIPSNIQCVSGHRAVRTLKYSGVEDYKLITLLREPTSQVKSHFNHISRNIRKKHYWDIRWKNMTIEDYIKQKLFKDFDNGLVRRLCGENFNYGRCRPSHLAKAKRVLENAAFVGIQERFLASVFSMSKCLNWSSWPIIITTNQAQSNKIITSEYDELITEHNSFDIELYEFAVGIFSAQDKSAILKDEFSHWVSASNAINSPAFELVYSNAKRNDRKQALKDKLLNLVVSQ